MSPVRAVQDEFLLIDPSLDNGLHYASRMEESTRSCLRFPAVFH